MDFLNFLYTNADVANLISSGIEGVNYTFAEGSDKIIIPNGSYIPAFYKGGNEKDMYIVSPAGEDYIDQCEAFKNATIESPIMGYMFDDSDFQTESSVISTVVQKYLPSLQNGIFDTEEDMLAYLDEFNRLLLLSLLACGVILTGCDTDKSTAKNFQPVCNIAIETVTYGEALTDTSKIEDAINEITISEIGCSISILNINIAEHADWMSRMVTNENQADICMAGLTTPLSNLVADGVLLDLGEYIDQYGHHLTQVFGSDMEAGKINNKIYAIPANNANGKVGGYVYNKDMSDSIGVSIPEKCTADEFEEYYQQVHLAYPDVYMTTMGRGDIFCADNFYHITAFGDHSYAQGVVLNSEENTVIQNWFATDEAHEYYHRIKKWHDSGMIPKDSIIDGNIGQTLFANQETFCMLTNTAPAELPIQSTNYEFAIGMTQIIDSYIDTDAIQEHMWCVPVTCTHPDMAIKFLDLLYTDSRIANCLSYGIEGTHYERTNNEGIIQTIDENASKYHKVFSMFGDQTNIYYQIPAKEGIQEEIKAFSKNAKQSLLLGYVFDITTVSQKVAAVNQVVETYAPSLETGILTDVDAALERLCHDMDENGMQNIIDENQRQLNLRIKFNGLRGTLL